MVIFLLAGAALLGAFAGGAIGAAATGTATGVWVGAGVGALAGVGIAGTAYALSRPKQVYYYPAYPAAYPAPAAYPQAYNQCPTCNGPVYYAPAPRTYYYPSY